MVMSSYKLIGVDPQPLNKPTPIIAVISKYRLMTIPFLLFLYASTESGLQLMQSLLLCKLICIIKILS